MVYEEIRKAVRVSRSIGRVVGRSVLVCAVDWREKEINQSLHLKSQVMHL